ncbi:MAG: nitrous oxide reductase family maturation protein NosD [Thermomicrobiales bacterium]|nr:nitrous oxide reductase family maturation protein NosD [Thermomicrobiales bacterium]
MALRFAFSVLLLVVVLSSLQPASAQGSDPGSDAGILVCETCEITSIAEAVAAAEERSVIEVRGGAYPGGLVLDKSVVLRGTDGAVIDGQGEGTLVAITAPDVTLDGFTLRGTGSSHDKEDSAVLVDAERATISNNILEDVLFGIYLREANGSVVQNNVVVARPVDVALRGDGIRIWYSNDVVVDGNQASDGRDMILWYSNYAVVTNNEFNRNRYGMHLMFSDGALIEGNSLNENTIGLYVMYSRDVTIRGNSMSNNAGATGGGLGLKDVDNAVVEGNRFVNNQTGAQIDTSPREPGIENYFIDNVFAFNDVGIALQPAVRHNTFTGNAFIDNNEHVSLMGRGELKEITWAVDGHGNYWSDYAGYDADRDGVGDLPYTSQQLFESLVGDYPELRLFSYSPASMAIDFAAEAFPSFRPQVKFEDPSPLMKPAASPLLPAVAEEPQTNRVAIGLAGAVGVLAAIAGSAHLRRRARFPIAPATAVVHSGGVS